jgi:protein YibB
MSFTLVTALININRSEWGHYGRKWEQYLSYFENILRLDVAMCIYVEKDTFEFVSKCREGYEHTKIIIISLEDYVLYPKLEQITQIQKNPDYIDMCIDKVCPEVCVPLYDVVVNNKVEFLHRTCIDNPFLTKYFIWLDSGYGHSKFHIPVKKQWHPFNYIHLASTNQIVINTLQDTVETKDPREFFKVHQDFIDGGLIVGTKKAIQLLHNVYYPMIGEIMAGGIIDDDQYFMTMAYVRNKELFNLVRIPGWFYRQQIMMS